MATEKKFTIAGVSTKKGVVTFRFANGKAKVRIGVLTRDEHTDIQLFDLPKAMTKDDAAAWLKTEKGIDAVIPTGRKAKVALTAEQIKEKKVTEQRKKANERKKAARLAKKAGKDQTAPVDPVQVTTEVTQEVVSEVAAEALIDETQPATQPETKLVDETN